MPAGDLETIQQGGSWLNRIQGTSHILSSHPTRREAETIGRRRAITLQIEHNIYDPDGRIAARNSYKPEPGNQVRS